MALTKVTGEGVGSLPAISGASLTSLPAANLTGTVATARLGSGTAGTGNFLRGDGSWQTAGSTSASDLTSGTLPTARLPAGSVLQVVQGIGGVVTTNSTTPTTVASKAITILAGSKVYASCVGDMNPVGASDWSYYQIYRDGTAVSQKYIGQTSGGSVNVPFAIFYLDAPSSAGTYTYTTKVWQGVGTMIWGEAGARQAPTMVLMEVVG